MDKEDAVTVGDIVESFAARVRPGHGAVLEQGAQAGDEVLGIVAQVVDDRCLTELK